MKLQDLIEKGFIDVKDDITFRTHADVLRLFGTDVKVFQRAAAKHPHDAGVYIWFPAFYQDDGNDWENTFGVNEESVFERRKFDNKGHLKEMMGNSDWHRRILFAKIEAFGRKFYRFKGIYDFDPQLSQKAKKAVYRRTATTAKIYPVE